MSRLFILAVALAVALATAGASWAAEPKGVAFNRPSAIFPPGDSARGQMLSVQCSACHGEGAVLLGEPPAHAPKLRYQRPSSVFYALQDYRDGRRSSDLMTTFARPLSDQDMRDLAVSVTAGPNRRRGAPVEGPQLASSRAHAKVSEVCGFCHGETGLSVMDGYPALAGQFPDYLERALRDYRSGSRASPIMQYFARALTSADIAQLTAYFAAQPGLESIQ